MAQLSLSGRTIGTIAIAIAVLGALLAAVLRFGSGSLIEQMAVRDTNLDPNTYPNIIVLVADDLGVDWGPCFADHNLMPNVERLCEQGVVFDRTYATPSCSPTRATILSGRYALRTRASATRRKPGDPPNIALPLDEIIIPELIDQIEGVAYKHAAFGKWHLDDNTNGGRRSPILSGFQKYSGTFAFGDYFSWPRYEDGEKLDVVEKYKATAFVDDAIAWIDEAGTQPWFTWMAFYSPHSPLHLPPTDLHDFDHLDPVVDLSLAKGQRPNPIAQDYFSATMVRYGAWDFRIWERTSSKVLWAKGESMYRLSSAVLTFPNREGASALWSTPPTCFQLLSNWPEAKRFWSGWMSRSTR